ncbi:hypothetical protein SAMN06295974_3840 [Plantibacter flavus]|uniref:Uncharacterized protein n=1 Tax=Plantibacter flavus TaxID=150123 RepID=A0A3N2BLU8_9MICO|nr:hypothetical protein [Plantibacter flavus]ROR76014.1 hypothetical protein EDD42_3966 [Plantibacter flavus]SMG49288.1 hypothetical protein SAMN06295974_3840 [Plantibacter flavus]
MAERPRDLSQRELDDLIHELILAGREDTPEFLRAFKEDERRSEEADRG